MEHNFILRYRLDPGDASEVDDVIERLGEAGCADAVVGIGAPGKVVLDFSRSATSLQQAIRTAIADVENAIPTAVLYSTEVPASDEPKDELLMAKLAIMESLMTEVAAWIDANQLTYAGAAKILGVKPHRLVEISRMNPQNLTIDTLVDMLLRAGKGVRIGICQSPSK